MMSNTLYPIPKFLSSRKLGGNPKHYASIAKSDRIRFTATPIFVDRPLVYMQFLIGGAVSLMLAWLLRVCSPS
jgi:hypothetical protein